MRIESIDGRIIEVREMPSGDVIDAGGAVYTYLDSGVDRNYITGEIILRAYLSPGGESWIERGRA